MHLFVQLLMVCIVYARVYLSQTKTKPGCRKPGEATEIENPQRKPESHMPKKPQIITCNYETVKLSSSLV